MLTDFSIFSLTLRVGSGGTKGFCAILGTLTGNLTEGLTYGVVCFG